MVSVVRVVFLFRVGFYCGKSRSGLQCGRFSLYLHFTDKVAFEDYSFLEPAIACSRNAMHLTVKDISEILTQGTDSCGALYADAAADAGRRIDILLTDSRSLTDAEHSMFFAITTRGNDGHRFVADLYKRGVRAFVVNRVPSGCETCPDAAWLVVPDTVAALQRISAAHSGGHVVAITGSRGKTTLKEWIFQLMEPLAEVIRSPRSYNSQIGVPLSLWEIEPSTDLAVIETGVSQRGEMRRLADIIRPDTVILTNILANHDAGFASRQEKSDEKAVLASAESVKTLIFNADDPLISQSVSPYARGRRVVSWSAEGNPEAAVQLRRLPSTVAGKARLGFISEDCSGEIEYPAGKDYSLENAANALAFMISQGIPSRTIEERFRQITPIGTRLNVSEGVNSCSLIFDSYTSDFSSLGPVLDFMRRRTAPGQTKTLILSDLRHESHPGGDIYTAIAESVRRAGIDRFIGIGPQINARKDVFPKSSQFFASTDEMLAAIDPSDFSDETILIKGAPEFGFMRIFEALEARKHETVLEVNLDALVRNFNHFRSLMPPQTGLIAMVKASGYGAGSFEIAKTLQDAGAAYLAVAVLDEGIELRRKGISMPIMVMNPKVVNYRSMFVNRLEPEIYSSEMLADVIKAAKRAGTKRYPIHIKLDTGMHRTGFVEEELPALMDALEGQDFVEAKSVFSHLATADCTDMDVYTEAQLARFARFTDYMLSRSRCPFKRHILNTAGIMRYAKAAHYDMARLGIGLYGIDPLGGRGTLTPVSRLRTVIISVRRYAAGEAVGYGRRGMLDKPATIATIPIGYADGMNRRFGCGALKVLVNGQEAPTVGSICMDACMIDVSGIDCKVGDEVVIFGPEAPVERMAEVLGTIPYEVLTGVSPRVKRIYYRE